MQRTDITNSIINSYKLKLVVDMSNGNPQTLFDNRYFCTRGCMEDFNKMGIIVLTIEMFYFI